LSHWGLKAERELPASRRGDGDDRVSRVAGALESSIHAALQWA
jgi:hypothetical protein